MWTSFEGTFWALDLTLKGHEKRVRAATFNEDATRLVSASEVRGLSASTPL